MIYPSNDKHRFCNAPSIFNPKGFSDSERAKSPTSPLDIIKPFSEAGISHWNENSLDSQLSSTKQQSETIPIGSPHGFANPSSETGMENSESYTCVTSHAPKSTTKHIYSKTVQYSVEKQHEHGLWSVVSPPRSNSNVPVFPVEHFLRSCCLCNRQLNHGKDIYMYRGDKAFCSVECRYQQILIDERMETFPASPPYSRSATSSGALRKYTATDNIKICVLFREKLKGRDEVRFYEAYRLGMSFVVCIMPQVLNLNSLYSDGAQKLPNVHEFLNKIVLRQV